jgi:hypothetical protein
MGNAGKLERPQISRFALRLQAFKCKQLLTAGTNHFHLHLLKLLAYGMRELKRTKEAKEVLPMSFRRMAA